MTGVLGALSPWHIYYSAEIRMYALESALGVLTLWALWRSTKRGRRADWALYVVSAVAFAWTDLFAILALLGQAAWLFWNSRSMTAAQWRKVKFAWATILVSTLPLALVGAGALTRGSGTGVHSGLLRGLTLLADVGAGFIATAPAHVEGARTLVRELETCWPEAERVRRWARVLAPPIVTLRPGEHGRPLDRERAWLRQHAREYPGCWLAVSSSSECVCQPARVSRSSLRRHWCA